MRVETNKQKKSIQEVLNNIKSCNIYMNGIPERKERKN